MPEKRAYDHRADKFNPEVIDTELDPYRVNETVGRTVHVDISVEATPEQEEKVDMAVGIAAYSIEDVDTFVHSHAGDCSGDNHCAGVWRERALHFMAKVAAVRDLADSLEWKRPDTIPCRPEDIEACCGHEAACSAMLPSVKVVGRDDLLAILDDPTVDETETGR